MFLLGGAVAFAGCEKENGGDNKEPEEITSVTDAAGNVYKVVKLADGNYWMAENLRYVPEGKTVSDDPAVESGIWYPLEITSEKDETITTDVVYVCKVSKDVDYIKKVGYYYDLATAVGVDKLSKDNITTFEGTQGICPKGWHIPTESEFSALFALYKKDGEAKTYWADLDKDGFNSTLTQMLMRNTSSDKGKFLPNKNLQNIKNHLMTAGYLMTSTVNSASSWKDDNGKITTQNKCVTFQNIYSKKDDKINQGIVIANLSNFAGIPVRCVKDKTAE